MQSSKQLKARTLNANANKILKLESKSTYFTEQKRSNVSSLSLINVNSFKMIRKQDKLKKAQETSRHVENPKRI